MFGKFSASLVLLFTFNINVTNMTVCSDKTLFNKDCVTQLEHWIDEYQQQLPPLKNFILPVCFQTQFHMLAVIVSVAALLAVLVGW